MIAAEPRIPLIVNAYEGYSLVSRLVTGDGVKVVSWANFMAADDGSKLEWAQRAVRVAGIVGLVLVAWGLDWTLVPLLRWNDQRRVVREEGAARVNLVEKHSLEQASNEHQDASRLELCREQQRSVQLNGFNSLLADHIERERQLDACASQLSDAALQGACRDVYSERLDAFAENVCREVLGEARQEIFTQLQQLAQQDTVTLFDLKKLELELGRAERLPPFKKLVVSFQYCSTLHHFGVRPQDLEFIMRIAPRLWHVEELVVYLDEETFGFIPALSVAFSKVQRLQVHFNYTSGNKLTSEQLLSACSMVGQRFFGLQSVSFNIATLCGEANADEAVGELAKYAKHLTSLDLSGFDLTGRGLKSVEEFAFLERLSFYAGKIGIGRDAEVISMARACPRLRHLTMSWLSLKQETFSDILFYLPKLEMLSIEGLYRSKFEIGAHIRHEHLRELNLYRCEVSFADLITYAERAPALRKVILQKGKIQLTETEQALLQSRFPDLELVIKD